MSRPLKRTAFALVWAAFTIACGLLYCMLLFLPMLWAMLFAPDVFRKLKSGLKEDWQSDLKEWRRLNADPDSL